MLIRCRLLDRPGTEHSVEADEPDYAADHFVHAHVNCSEPGIVFVELVESGALWRVQILDTAGVGDAFMSTPVTLDAAREELRVMIHYRAGLAKSKP